VSTSLTGVLARLSAGTLIALAGLPAFGQPVAAAGRPAVHAPTASVSKRPSAQSWSPKHVGVKKSGAATKPSTRPPRVATNPQLVQDPGFEAGTPWPAWTKSSFTGSAPSSRTLIDTNKVHSGTYSAHLCQAVPSCDDAVYQPIAVPNRVLSATLSYWFLVTSQDPPTSCADQLGVGLTDTNFNASPGSGVSYCSDWSGQPWTADTIDETSFLQGHAGQTIDMVAVGTADAEAIGWSDYNVDDVVLTISYATGSSDPYSAVSYQQYRLSNSNGSTWTDMDSTYLAVSVTPTMDSSALVSGNADLWTATAGVNQDLGIAVSGGTYPTLAGQPEAWKESGGNAGTFSPNAAFVQTVLQLKANTTYTLKLQWKTNHITAGTILAAAGLGPVFSPTRLSVQLVPGGTGMASVQAAASQNQFWMTGNDGSTWTQLPSSASPPTVSLTPLVDGKVIVGANADLWTANAGVNQDLAINASGGAFGANQILAWKESGGFAGIFSPNAAYVQTVQPVVAGQSYTFSLRWKTNHVTAGTIYAGAGPIGTKFSPTTLSVQFIPYGAGVQDAVSNNQYQLTGSDGIGWFDIDPAKLSLTITPPIDCVATLSGNADLWTVNAGYNQDLGIQLSWPGHTLPPATMGWKESGGFAGTFSPNAAFVQTVVPLVGGTTYTAKLQWKTNKASPSNAVIEAAAGLGPTFSPTRLTAQLLCPQKLVITTAPQTLAAGATSSPITVQVRDAFGNVLNAPAGGQTVILSSTSGGATFTPPSPLSIPQGSSQTTFTYRDTVAGTPTISVSAPGLTGASQQETINPGSAASLSVAAPGTVTHGVAFNLTVTARDQFGNTATGYTGTVHFTSSDAAGTVNGSSILTFTYPFVPGDNGTHTFSVVLNTVGSQTITVSDAGPPLLTSGVAAMTVN
jgi:hypothetical protein